MDKNEKMPKKDAKNQKEFTCPMHPEIIQDNPGDCPKCGMTLEISGASMAKTKTEYTCPMHPEIIQDHPGDCPKCGMALEPLVVNGEEKNEELEYMKHRFWISTCWPCLCFFWL